MNVQGRTHELDVLVKDMLQPGPQTSAENVLSYLVHYYPLVKNKANVELLTISFLQCPLFAGINFRVVDAFRYIVDTKFKVSLPTLPFHEFYGAIYNGIKFALETDNSAYERAIPLMTGCLLSKNSRESFNAFPSHTHAIGVIDSYFQQSLKSALVIYFHSTRDVELALACIGCVYDEFSNSDLYDFLKVRSDLPECIVGLIFRSPLGLHGGKNMLEGDETGPVLRQLNRLSFLFAKFVEVYPARSVLLCLSNSCEVLNEYSVCVARTDIRVPLQDLMNTENWQLVKFSYFAIMIVLDGTITKILNTFRTPNERCLQVFSQVLSILFNLSFILEKIGSGDFESYNFVLESVLSCMVEFNQNVMAERVVSEMAQMQCNKPQLEFMLRVTDTLMPILRNDFVRAVLLPTIKKCLASPNPPARVHEIMLQYLTTNRTSNSMNEEMTSYISETLQQFPDNLTFGECQGILSRIFESLSPTETINAFDTIKMIAYASNICPVQVKFVNVNGERIQLNSKFSTNKSSYVGLLINLIHYLSIEYLPRELDSIRSLITSPYFPAVETSHLFDHLWDEILTCGRFFPKKGEVCLNWWYDNVNGVAKL